VQLFGYFIVYCPFYLIKVSGKGKHGHADNNVKYRSCEFDMTRNEIEIIGCAKGGKSLAPVGPCWTL
jgi:hypothetical protein